MSDATDNRFYREKQEQHSAEKNLHWSDPAGALRSLSSASGIPAGLPPLMIQAADEIERLQREVDALGNFVAMNANLIVSGRADVPRSREPVAWLLPANDENDEDAVTLDHSVVRRANRRGIKEVPLYERLSQPPNDSLLIPAALVAKAVEWMTNMESESDGEPDLEWLRVRRGLQERLPQTKAVCHSEACDHAASLYASMGTVDKYPIVHESMRRAAAYLQLLAETKAAPSTERYEAALRSIAASSCCGGCQEAKRVALAALSPAKERIRPASAAVSTGSTTEIAEAASPETVAPRPTHKHSWKPTDFGGAVCECGEQAAEWYCPNSPDHLCSYKKGNFDQCDFCGSPEERK